MFYFLLISFVNRNVKMITSVNIILNKARTLSQ